MRVHLPRLARARSTVVATVLATGALSVVTAVGPMVDDAAALSQPPVVTATMTGKAIKLSVGSTMHSGRVVFRVVAPTGDHTLQLLKLLPGYTAAQAMRDVNAAFGGNLKAIHNVDTRIHWLGGAEARSGHPGYFSETLYRGTYYLVDQNSNAMTTLRVTGSVTPRAWIPNNSTITAFNHGFGSPTVIPKKGWTLFRDTADEPHFIEFQAVKASTTAATVRAFLASGAQKQPPWALPTNVSYGVISPGTQVEIYHNLPAGKYLLMCWWPDDTTGMPHAMMGMWKLVWLK